MIVAYNIGVDGWTPCKTSRPPVLRGYGPVQISERAWEKLSVDKYGSRLIECAIGLTDTEHLVAVAAYIDRNDD